MLSPSFTLDAYLIMRSVLMSQDEAQELSSLLESREELTASLLLDDDLIREYPDIYQELMTIAQTHYTRADSPRVTRGNIRLAKDLKQALAQGINAILEAEKQRMPIADSLHESARQYARVQPASELDLHWRYSIDRE
ncbi:hypothetical protein [Bosea sp. NPDC055594]